METTRSGRISSCRRIGKQLLRGGKEKMRGWLNYTFSSKCSHIGWCCMEGSSDLDVAVAEIRPVGSELTELNRRVH